MSAWHYITFIMEDLKWVFMELLTHVHEQKAEPFIGLCLSNAMI